MEERRILDTTRRSDEAGQLHQTLTNRIVGQEEAVRTLVDLMENYRAGLSDKNKPVGNVLFLGPTGTGKTYAVEAMAEALFGDEKAMIKIDCAEYQHGHEIAKLIGSPPGYLGHKETHPLLTQEAIDKWNTTRLKLCILMFDEIEKASDSLWDLLLGILDKATLTTGTNVHVNFSTCIIVMTSNLGAAQISDAIDGGIGFTGGSENISERSHKELAKIALEAAKRKFRPEFVNRIDHIVTFQRLDKAQMREVLDVELMRTQNRFIKTCPVIFHFVTKESAKKVLLAEGYSPKYGARELRRVIERRIIKPLARLIATKQITDGDGVVISDVGKEEFEFATQPDLSIRLRLT